MPWIAPALMIGAQVVSGISRANAQKKATAAKNQQQKRADKFNRKAWRYSKEKLKGQYEYLKKGVQTKRENAVMAAAYKDDLNWQKWNYDLMIRQSEQEGLNAQYERSEQLYNEQLDFNSEAARIASEKEYRRYQDSAISKAFEAEDLQLQSLLKTDAIKAKGAVGRSTAKSVQSMMASHGRNSAILAESLTSAKRDLVSTLESIANDQEGADMQAFANRMLKPGILPIRPMPIRTPIPIFQDPKKPSKYDYGPKPVPGMQSPDTSGAILVATGANAMAGIMGATAGYQGADPGATPAQRRAATIKGARGY